MRFTTRTIQGRQFLLAQGRIDAAMLPALRAALDRFSGDEVWLSSPGGDAAAGNEAGQILHDSGFPVRIPAHWTCAGACAFMFLGGIIRNVDTAGTFAVQMFTWRAEPNSSRHLSLAARHSSTEEISRASAHQVVQDFDYVTSMGVSRWLLRDLIYPPAVVRGAAQTAGPRCLTQAELRTYNVVNVMGMPTIVTGGEREKPLVRP